jgi:hypothetical protein
MRGGICFYRVNISIISYKHRDEGRHLFLQGKYKYNILQTQGMRGGICFYRVNISIISYKHQRERLFISTGQI